MTDARSPMRALRAAAFAAVCVTLAALGHLYTSGHEIPFGALLTAFGTTGGVAWLAGGRRRGFRSLGAGLLTVQGTLHLLFAGVLPYGPSPASHDRHSMTGTGAGARAGLGMGGRPGMDMGAGGAAEPALGAVADTPVAMIAAHVLAAAVCALWLARGEAALFQLARTLGALALVPLRLPLTPARLPAVPRPAPLAPGAPAPRRFRGVVLAHSLSRRGPPVVRTARTTDPGAALVLTV
ncbi:hypothetical protein [Streptomyces sp. NPDC088261]|uniref:hypothetical protein n=1 Tax=Streptomyces sp. NPDC088261 TaxID=3365851 RepID=UPI003829F149